MSRPGRAPLLAAVGFLAGGLCLLPGLAAGGAPYSGAPRPVETGPAPLDPRAWLARMAAALEDLNYEGTLVQFTGSDATLMHVVHRVDGGRSTERVTAMDEVGREIIREGREEKWILPDQRAVLVQPEDVGADPAGPASRLQRQFGRDLRISDAYYRLSLDAGGRLVGRKTMLVAVRPLDSYRYGYRLWLDEATGMPLKIQIADSQNAVLEQVLFSDIKLPDRIPAAAVQPSVTINSFTWRRSDDAPPGQAPVAGASWRAVSLPPGFVLIAVNRQQADRSAQAMEHLVYSDGVASVSVFIDSGAGATEQTEGVSSVGAANAYTTTTAGMLVTAMGEVPPRTVEIIARSVRPDSAGAALPARP